MAQKMKKLLWDGYGLTNPNSGIFSHAHQLFLELAKKNHAPTILTSQPVYPAFASAQNMSVPAFAGRLAGKMPRKFADSKIIWPLRVQSMLLKNANTLAPEGIILHALSNLNLPIISQYPVKKVKTVLTIHDIIPLLAPDKVATSYAIQFKFILRRILAKVDRVITVSRWTHDSLVSYFPAIKDRIIIIPNGYPTAVISSNDLIGIRAEKSSKFKCLTIARYEKYKDFSLLSKIIKKASSEFQFTVVTDRVGKSFLEQEATQAIVNGNLKVLVNIDQPVYDRLFASHHLLLHTSYFEGFCLPAAQAMACMLPVLYRKGSALDEVVMPEISMGLLPSATESAWLHEMEILAQDGRIEASSELMEKWKQFMDNRMTWSSIAEQHLQIYKSLENS